jgi:hypothetical protein
LALEVVFGDVESGYWLFNDEDPRMVKMLVNMIGVEENDEVVDLNSRRAASIENPKDRVTITTLLGATLASYRNDSAPVAPPQGDLRVFAAAYDKVFGLQSTNLELREDVA